MNLIYVDSSSVDQIGFDAETGEVHVIFKHGGYYIYSDVPFEIWERFRDSASKGKFIHDEFIAKVYLCRKQ
jgi:hypothetical protein